jgi:hypothetical protein
VSGIITGAEDMTSMNMQRNLLECTFSSDCVTVNSRDLELGPVECCVFVVLCICCTVCCVFVVLSVLMYFL